ncbi:MAG: yvdD 2 [Rhodocyclales bacterium]|nr:yvdD 2 [Rhodocyclales bacterium]
MQSICVFCGASTGHNPVYRDAAAKLGETIAQQGLELVWGGGHVGLMGIVADAAIIAGGHVYGVIPRFMVARELAYPADPAGHTQIVLVDDMHTRKAAMAARADAFVALPGGFGTLDEFFEILTWAQLGLHDKPIGLLNVNGFFDPLTTMVEHMRNEGFVKPQHSALITQADTAETLLAALTASAKARSPMRKA